MTLLKSVNEKEATGVTKKVYEGFSNQLGKVPNVFKFHTASTVVFERLMGLMELFTGHENLDPVLISYLRIIVSNRNGGEYCERFQSVLIKMYGESEENVEQAIKDVTKLPMDEKRKALLIFAFSLVERECSNVEESLNELRKIGWSDKDIYEFCFIGGIQKGLIPLIKGFKVEMDY